MRNAATKLLIRPARDADCAAASELCWRSKAVWGYDEAFMNRCRDSLAVTPERLERETVLVAEGQSGRLLGVVSVSAADAAVPAETTGATDSEPPEPPSAELELLFVAPEAMRAGLGATLLDHGCRAARDRGARVLWILSDPGAESFYRRRGAVRVGMRPSDAIPGRELPWLRLAL